MKTTVALLCYLLISASVNAQQHGIINNAESPHVALKSIDIGDCQWTDGFWGEKFNLCAAVMMPHMGEILKGDIGHGYNNFKIAAGLMEGDHQGWWWHDGDFFKWMEAATYIYAINKDESIRKDLDEIIAVIGKAQQEDGYLSTPAIIRDDIDQYENRRYHEMYNSGHLFTTACIHYRVTGEKNLLNIAVKHADMLYSIFQPEDSEVVRFGFNQTQIMGLVEMYRTVGDKRYLELAEIFINRRGHNGVEDIPTTHGYPVGDMVQERVPLRKETEAVGHAVLALYYYAGAADVYSETGEQALLDALDRLWENVTEKKMYATGACGQTHYGASSRKDKIEEGFIDEYQMPNTHAYNETCANICNSMFSYRMLGIKGEAKYADVIELVLHNSGLSGISADGMHYYYSNPLRKIDGTINYKKMHTEFPQRQPYLKCFCCPPNLVRTIAKCSGWAYSKSANGLSVNLYGGNKLNTTLLDGSAIQLKQETQYPWDGAVKITLQSCKTTSFDMMLRIPGWAEGATLKVNGKDAGVDAVPGAYATLSKVWNTGDVIELDMPMDIKLIEGNPLIEETRNQAAIKRGPVVYAIESPDLPQGTSILDVYLPLKSELKAEYKPDFLGGLTTISGTVSLRMDHAKGMYHVMEKPEFKKFKTQFVPYYAWSNRGDAEMTVFMPLIWE